MKAKLHIKIDEFEFIETDVDGELQEIADQYQKIKEVFKPKFGLERLEWNKLLDKYLNTGKMESSEYYSLSPEQQNVIQELKKAFKRINK